MENALQYHKVMGKKGQYALAKGTKIEAIVIIECKKDLLESNKFAIGRNRPKAK
jgi:hypothetical protein